MSRARLALAVAALLLCAAIPAAAEVGQEGSLVGTFDAQLHPNSLPREEPTPVAVRVAGDFRDASGDPEQLAQLRRIKVAINRQGQLFDRGLPVCDVRRIQPAREKAARRICGDAIVGRGHIRLRARLSPQPSFPIRANLLVFNGPRRNGTKLIYAQAYSFKPPGAFVLTFRVTEQPGVFGTVLATKLPPSAWSWAYLTHFDMTLHRTYEYRGQRRSYVSAACTAPAGFDSAVFPFARATYGFAAGGRLSLSVARVCHVAK
ncbi:MAG TPA: hypothetical protein VFX45_08285 [Solirubrobacterales bacterium]|nr:hypothetical protein [Solirubrobacterales bacterium]